MHILEETTILCGLISIAIEFYNSSNKLLSKKTTAFSFSTSEQNYNWEFSTPSAFDYAILKFYEYGNPDKDVYIKDISLIGGALWQRVTQLQMSVDGMETEVSKKVGNNEIISKINQSAETVGIQANKINLTANDILNLIAGNAINLTSKNITITSDGFKVDKNGKVTCSNMNITGGSINLESEKGYSNMRISSVQAICDITGFGISVSENTDDNIPAQINTDVFDGEARMNIINRNLNASTEILGSGITTPKLTQTSLKSKKKYIKKLNVNATELIKNADICLYNLKGEKAKSKKHIGLVIGEGYNCPNEIISQDMQGVEQYSMTSLAWKAIQEIIEENNNLKERIEKLEAK